MYPCCTDATMLHRCIHVAQVQSCCTGALMLHRCIHVAQVYLCCTGATMLHRVHSRCTSANMLHRCTYVAHTSTRVRRGCTCAKRVNLCNIEIQISCAEMLRYGAKFESLGQAQQKQIVPLKTFRFVQWELSSRPIRPLSSPPWLVLVENKKAHPLWFHPWCVPRVSKQFRGSYEYV